MNFLVFLLGFFALSVFGLSGDNWVVIVGTSRFWYNYRHVANAVGVYRSARRLGVPEDHILLFLADDVACNPRNILPATLFMEDHRRGADLYGESLRVAFRNDDVTVDNFLRLLTGRNAESAPLSQRLLSGPDSNVFVYLTGHGGEEFLKFQDVEELTSDDLADAVHEMYLKHRFRELFIAVDTCQAASLGWRLRTPHVLFVGSSNVSENSLSYQSDSDIGLAVVDRFTYHMIEYLNEMARKMEANRGVCERYSLDGLRRTLTREKLMSNAVWRTDLFGRPLESTPIMDFFGGCTPRTTDAFAEALLHSAADVDWF